MKQIFCSSRATGEILIFGRSGASAPVPGACWCALLRPWSRPEPTGFVRIRQQEPASESQSAAGFGSGSGRQDSPRRIVCTFQPYAAASINLLALGYSSAGTVIASWGRCRPTSMLAIVSALRRRRLRRPRRIRLRAAPARSAFLPSPLSFDEAAFTTAWSGRAHGVRTAEVKLGDIVAVIGLGLLGQLAAADP